MANLIILEGIERSGKSSMIEMLDKKFGKSVKVSNKQPDNVPFEYLGLFYEGAHQFMNNYFKLLPNETFIIDRFFLSEFVYSKKFDRQSWMTIDYVKDLCKHNTVNMIYLKNNYDDYIQRGPKNKIKLNRQDYSEMLQYFDDSISYLKSIIPNLNILIINTTELDLNQVYNETSKWLKHQLQCENIK